ncbi:MAG: cellulase family glycosylhydrolase [Spirochaetales bacterium]|nr:cellulase family glycosylhydrolase [Spirochaetales bacterium]
MKKSQMLTLTFIAYLLFVAMSVQAQINGAVYWPATAYNVDQFWSEYDSSITERDFGFAQSVNINALRVFGSYYVYSQNNSTYESRIKDLLGKASEKGIKILYVIYEGCGNAADDSINRTLKDPLRAIASKSPPSAVTTNSSQWQPYRDHVTWFMNRFKNDSRLLGIEIMNEPNADDKAFAHDMVRIAVSLKGTVPLSVGTLPGQYLEYVSDGVDVLQFHHNFPTTLEGSANTIQNRIDAANNAGLPVWMTEWQRIRPSGANWSGDTAVPEAERFTDLASMAGQVKSYQYQVGAFFWSLMVKPAYLSGQRNAGTINGLFWEDGAVWDLAGARIISGNPNLNLPERKRIPFYILRFENKEFSSWLQCTDAGDGTGKGNNVQAVANKYTGNKTKWRIVRIDNDAWFRLENVEYNLWLQCTSVADATNGQPNASSDGDTLAVRAVAMTNTGDRTKWRWVSSGAGDWYFFLQNKYTGYYLQVTDITDFDGAGIDGGTQVRCVPSTKTGTWTRFRSIDASTAIADPAATPVPSATATPTSTSTRTPTSTPAAATSTPTPVPTQVLNNGFSDNFSDDAIGNAWTMYGGSWNESGTILRQNSTSQGDPCKAIAVRTGLSLDSNQTITAKVYVASWTDGDSARAGVSLFTGTADGRGYNLLFHNNHSTVQFLDDAAAWGPSYTFNWSSGTWYWFKLKMENGTLSGKVWQAGSTEPSNWPYTWTRSGRSGYPALNGGTSGHGGSCTVFFDDVTITSP